MSNVQAPRDENQVPVALGVDGSGFTLPLRVDPATGRLLLDVAGVSSTSPSTLPADFPRDANQVHVSGGVDDNGTVTPFIVDNRNGRLWVDLVIES